MKPTAAAVAKMALRMSFLPETAQELNHLSAVFPGKVLLPISKDNTGKTTDHSNKSHFFLSCILPVLCGSDGCRQATKKASETPTAAHFQPAQTWRNSAKASAGRSLNAALAEVAVHVDVIVDRAVHGGELF
jgi:hypothetical protein